jgi:hypothetical protein
MSDVKVQDVAEYVNTLFATFKRKRKEFVNGDCFCQPKKKFISNSYDDEIHNKKTTKKRGEIQEDLP